MRHIFTCIFCFVFFTVSGQIPSNILVKRSGASGGNPEFGFLEFKPDDYTTNGAYKHPVIIALHGQGDWGDGTISPDTDPTNATGVIIGRVLKGGVGELVRLGATMKFSLYNRNGSFVVLMPQLNNQGAPSPGPWQPFYVQTMIDYAKANLNIDPDKIFITGYSYGGGGTWVHPGTSLANANQIAGVIPVCGIDAQGQVPNLGQHLANGNVAVLGVHAGDDQTVSAFSTINAVGAVSTFSPFTKPQFFKPGLKGGHNIYQTSSLAFGAYYAYDTTNRFMYPNIYQWMLGVSRANLIGIPGSNQAPVADAGEGGLNINKTVDPARYAINLDASASFDNKDVIVRYIWELAGVSNGGEAAAIRRRSNINQVQSFPDSSVNVPITITKLGTYNFRLRLLDLYGAETVVVKQINLTNGGGNTPVFINIGPDVTITNGASNVPVNVDLFDWEIDPYSFGAPISRQWRVISAPAGVTVVFPGFNWFQGNISGLTAPGQYQIEYAITDGANTSRDTIVISQESAVLPVQLSSWQGKSIGTKHVLQWSTSYESGASHFEIEHSINGQQFKTIGQVAAVGTSSVRQVYQFEHLQAPKGVSYYRLRMIDKDNSKKLSATIQLYRDGDEVAISVFPNPVKDKINILIEGNTSGAVQVSLWQLSGQKIHEEMIRSVQGQQTISIQLPSLQSGIYYLRVEGVGLKPRQYSIVKE
jgi:hypothetical protein